MVARQWVESLASWLNFSDRLDLKVFANGNIGSAEIQLFLWGTSAVASP